MKNRVIYSIIIAAFGLLLSCGCGYQLGSMMHPQVKTIAIEPVTNETLFPYVSDEMRNMLCESFVVDGSLKVKNLKTADCILKCKVTEITISEVAQADFDDDKVSRTTEWSAAIKAEFTVIIPSHKKPLIGLRKISCNARFQGYGDYTTMQRQGIKQAAYNAAQKIVHDTTEAW